MTRLSCPTNNGHGLQERNYVCGAIGRDYLIGYAQDFCIGCSASFFSTIVLCSLIVINCTEKSLHREVTHDLRVMQGLVFTTTDHFPHSFHMVYPFALHALLDTIFLDATVFKRYTAGISSILANLKSCFQSFPTWSRKYSWGCKWSASWPVARILPTPSKGCAKARPIIACDYCWHSRLTAFLAKGVFRIMTVVFPPGQTFNMLSIQQTLRII